MLGNKRQLNSIKEARKAKYIVGGEIDHAAIRKEAEATADRAWTGSHMIYGSKEEMIVGFVADIMKDLK